jgi:2-polyprenyl-3-methyl-5-hydroxy-6-metoxy-1,4-benzoquinol methylase
MTDTPLITPLHADSVRRIAAAFAPERVWGNRWDQCYTHIKLSTDPLYPGVLRALAGTRAPLLDLGCGLGLLAHTLHDAGLTLPYVGVDNDAAKIRRARQIAARNGLAQARFDQVDLAAGWPQHAGSVAILDVLQYLDAPTQHGLLQACAAMVPADGVLVVRSTLADDSRRGRTSLRADAWAHRIGWMQFKPRHYPTAASLRGSLEAAGMAVELQPLYGNTPFNNWLLVARPR